MIKWLNWFNLVIPITIVAISINIPLLVAALGGILPPGCGTLFPARCPALVRLVPVRSVLVIGSSIAANVLTKEDAADLEQS